LRKSLLIAFLAISFFSAKIFGQSVGLRPRELSEAIASGDVTLTAKGNGSSSGAAVDGYLKNNTPNELRINVILGEGFYLRNSGSGQNMIATQIFLADGEYSSDGTQDFIRLFSGANAQIMFLAFCADFERDIPSSNEAFSVAPVPAASKTIASKISRYMADNFDSDDTTAIQLALWRSQGQTQPVIASKFQFTGVDWDTATRIMNY
jgi:hypothetical protein